jgi:hypothetical protein
LMTSVAAVLLTTGAGASGSMADTAPSDATAWADAVKSDTLEAYAAFALMYPESEHAQSAYSKLSGDEPVSPKTDAMPEGNPVSTLGFAQRSFMII